MRLMAPLFSLSVVLACLGPSAAAATRGSVEEDQVFGCVHRGDLTRIRALSEQRNSEAVMGMLSDQKCFVLETGEKIVVDTSSSWAGDIRVRTENSSAFLWTSRNALRIPTWQVESQLSPSKDLNLRQRGSDPTPQEHVTTRSRSASDGYGLAMLVALLRVNATTAQMAEFSPR